jgi:adenosylcobyric acid synthase
MEGSEATPGLGLLAIQTTMQPQKVTRISTGRLVSSTLFGKPVPSLNIKGYEIHIGETHYLEAAEPFAQLRTECDKEALFDGCTSPDGFVFGSYLHGLFDDDSFRHAFLISARAFYNLTPASHLEDWKRQREESLNRLADAVRASLDLREIFSWAGLTYAPRSAEGEGNPSKSAPKRLVVQSGLVSPLSPCRRRLPPTRHEKKSCS